MLKKYVLQRKMQGVNIETDEDISPVTRKLRPRGRMEEHHAPSSPVKRRRRDVKRTHPNNLSPVLRVKKRKIIGDSETIFSPVKRSSRWVGRKKDANKTPYHPPSPIRRQKKRKFIGESKSGFSPVKRMRGRATTSSLPAASPRLPPQREPSHTPPNLLLPSQTPSSTPPPPPPPALPGAKFVCKSCPNRFASYESLEYHQNLKLRALHKHKISAERFQEDLHLAACPIKSCCFTSATVDTLREHLITRHRQTVKLYLDARSKRMRELYVILKHSPAEKGVITCPACLSNFHTTNNLARHQKDSCRGYGQNNCVICAAHFRDRRQMLKHMEAAHPPPPGITLTGVFAGKPKDRVGDRTERSRDLNVRESLSQFTFLPSQLVVTTANEFFNPSTAEGLRWLIQRSRSMSGNSVLRLNVSSLIRKGQSQTLIPFDTMARLINFSSSESPAAVSSR